MDSNHTSLGDSLPRWRIVRAGRTGLSAQNLLCCLCQAIGVSPLPWLTSLFELVHPFPAVPGSTMAWDFVLIVFKVKLVVVSQLFSLWYSAA